MITSLQEVMVMSSTEEITAWVRGRLPDDWFTEPVEVTVDREEITVVGRVAAPEGADEETPDAREAAIGRITRFREDTREARIRIAREAEHRFGRKVAWGAACGNVQALFTNLSIPVMTRLRQPQRRILDTLVDSGVARSRSEALAWCVRLVGDNAEEWLGRLREAMTEVERIRDEGPGTT
jgi:hypothetical protein